MIKKNKNLKATLSILLIFLLSSEVNAFFIFKTDTIIKDDIVILSEKNDTIRVKKFFYQKKLVKMISFYSNDIIESEYHFKNNEMNGSIKEWSKKGVLIHHSNRVRGSIDGASYSWYGSGIMKSKGFFNNNKGVLMSFYETGELQSLETLSGKKVYIGICQYWYANGGIKNIRDYSLDVQPFSAYYENGLILKSGYLYKGEIKDEVWKFWNNEGKLIKEEIWDKGELLETKEY